MNIIIRNNNDVELDLTPKKYVFVRLNDPSYKNSAFGIVLSILKAGIKTLKPAIDGICYSHATINTVLDDGFYGLTANKTEYAVRREYLSGKIDRKDINPNPLEMYHHDKSRFSIYAIEVNEDEYNLVDSALKKAVYDKNFSYNMAKLLIIKFFGDKYNDNLRKAYSSGIINADSEAKKTLEIMEKEMLVCSGFVGSIMQKCIKNVKDSFGDDESYGSFLTPSSLTYIPGLNKIVDYKFDTEYDSAIKECIRTNPEFKEYYKRR